MAHKHQGSNNSSPMCYMCVCIIKQYYNSYLSGVVFSYSQLHLVPAFMALEMCQEICICLLPVLYKQVHKSCKLI